MESIGKLMVSGFVLLVVVGVFLSYAPYEEKEVLDTGVALNEQGEKVYTPPQYDDEEFLDWLEISFNRETKYFERTGKLIKDSELEYAKNMGAAAEKYTRQAINEIDNFNVSPNLEVSRIEYRSALDDAEISFYWVQAWCDTQDEYEGTMLLESIENTFVHLENTKYLLGA